MARQTFQGLLRSTGGRPSNVPNRATGTPTSVMRVTHTGIIQMVAPASLGTGTLMLGMLPAFFAPTAARLITAQTSGTVQIVLPAYDGLDSVTLATIAHTAGVGALALAAGEQVSYGIDRPIALVGSVSVVGLAVVGLEGFSLDNGFVSGD